MKMSWLIYKGMIILGNNFPMAWSMHGQALDISIFYAGKCILLEALPFNYVIILM